MPFDVAKKHKLQQNRTTPKKVANFMKYFCIALGDNLWLLIKHPQQLDDSVKKSKLSIFICILMKILIKQIVQGVEAAA